MKFLARLVFAAVIAASGANAQTFKSSAGDLTVTTVASGLVHPWSLAFLPDGRMLVTERPGRTRIVTRDGKLSAPLAGVPPVVAGGQAGLLDVVLDRAFAQNQTIYFCFNTTGGNVVVSRAHLDSGATPELTTVKEIFRQTGPAGGANVACRIAQATDGNLFVSLGDHFSAHDDAQKLTDTIGKIVHIKPDGTVPPDNPFIGKAGARPEIWSYGHCNAEGLAFNSADGKLWEQEHGPKGGDEINIIEKGKNYGWPLVSYGVNYDGTPVGDGKQKMAGTEQPVWHWTPSIAPSGMAFITSDLFKGWKGSLNGALKFQLLVRLELKGDKVVKEERLLQGLRERIRDVRQGPDGALYLLTDNSEGRILRLAPAQ